MEEKVSIIVPVYNNEAYIEKCIDSICAQSYDNLEIIVIDDGSRDASAAIIKSFAAKDERVICLQQENQGVSAARNAGIKYATGTYLTFIDGDDYVGKHYIRDLAACAAREKADMVICGLKMTDVDGHVIKEIIPGKYVRGAHEEWTFRLSAVASHLYRRELWERYDIKFHEGERGEDMPIALFFAGICQNIVTLQRAEYYYVQHEKSAMHNFQGLRKNGLPYAALEETILKLQKTGIHNSREFHELFVLRILATFVQLAKGAEAEQIEKLAHYIGHVINDYYPHCTKNSKAKIFAGLDIPFLQRLSVAVLIWTNKMGVLPWFLRMVCR